MEINKSSIMNNNQKIYNPLNQDVILNQIGEELGNRGFVFGKIRSISQLGQNRIFMAYDFWLSVLCRGNDASCCKSL